MTKQEQDIKWTPKLQCPHCGVKFALSYDSSWFYRNYKWYRCEDCGKRMILNFDLDVVSMTANIPSVYEGPSFPHNDDSILVRKFSKSEAD